MPNFEKTISFGSDSAGKLEQSNRTLFMNEEALSNYLNSADSGIVCVECVTSRARCKILIQECRNCRCGRNRDTTGCLHNTQVFFSIMVADHYQCPVCFICRVNIATRAKLGILVPNSGFRSPNSESGSKLGIWTKTRDLDPNSGS